MNLPPFPDIPTSPEDAEPFHAFLSWANGEDYDTAHAYDTDRSRWVFFSPMTADLWKCWIASRSGGAVFRSVGKADFHMSAELDVCIDDVLYIRTHGGGGETE